MIYPWQNEQWQQLQRTRQEKRLPHALLFVGMRGVGKAHFAECFMRAQLCQQSLLDSACQCHSCRLISGKSHPNVLWIEPEKAGAAIKIDQVRDVTEFISQTSLQGETRFVVINPAANMNVNAANALLKTLEEPSSGSIMILITEQTSHLPATILSRCQSMYFPGPATHLALAWLKQNMPDNTISPELVLRLSHGAPLAAIELMREDKLASRLNLLKAIYALSQKQADPLHAAADMAAMETLHVLDFTLGFIMDLLRLHLAADVSNVINQDFIPQLTDLQQRTLPYKITQYADYLLQLRGQLQKGINLNKQLMVETILIRWMECLSTAGACHVSC